MAFFPRAFISAYHDVSIANVSRPRRELRHLFVFSADLRKVATEATENNIGKMLDIRRATGAKKIGRARAGEALNWSPKTGTKTAIYTDLRSTYSSDVGKTTIYGS
jgi:hypothetical protein